MFYYCTVSKANKNVESDHFTYIIRFALLNFKVIQGRFRADLKAVKYFYFENPSETTYHASSILFIIKTKVSITGCKGVFESHLISKIIVCICA